MNAVGGGGGGGKKRIKKPMKLVMIRATIEVGVCLGLNLDYDVTGGEPQRNEN